jgi:hypothetical protein
MQYACLRSPHCHLHPAVYHPLLLQTRQRLGLGMAGRDKTFVPTPNVRNPQVRGSLVL